MHWSLDLQWDLLEVELLTTHSLGLHAVSCPVLSVRPRGPRASPAAAASLRGLQGSSQPSRRLSATTGQAVVPPAKRKRGSVGGHSIGEGGGALGLQVLPLPATTEALATVAPAEQAAVVPPAQQPVDESILAVNNEWVVWSEAGDWRP